MKKILLSLAMFCMSAMTFAQKEVTIKAGTLVPFQSVNTVRAADVDKGEKLNFRVARDINVDGVTAIPYGSMVSATVLKAKKSSWWGTRGRLQVIAPEATDAGLPETEFSRAGSMIVRSFLPCDFFFGGKDSESFVKRRKKEGKKLGVWEKME